jgi:hypothetical protein
MEDVVPFPETVPDGDPGAYLRARQLAEQALHEQAIGRPEAADRLGAEALRLDPAAVAEVLAEHDAAHEPDARDRRTADRDADRIVRPAARGGDAPLGAGAGAGRAPEGRRS